MAGGGTFPKRSSTTTPSKPQRAPSASSSSSKTKRNKSILSFFEKSDGPPPQATSRQPRITQFASASGSERGRGANGSGNTSGNGNGSGIGIGNGNGGRGTTANGSRFGARAGVTTGGLFLEDSRNAKARTDDLVRERSRSRTPDDIWEEGDVVQEEGRYNENGSSVKRQKTGKSTESLLEDGVEGNKTGSDQSKSKAKQSGPFIDESDSEEDLDVFGEFEDTPGNGSVSNKENLEIERTASPVREATSYIENEDTNFDALDEEGLREEFLGSLSPAGNECEEEQTCPICQSRLDGLSEMV